MSNIPRARKVLVKTMDHLADLRMQIGAILVDLGQVHIDCLRERPRKRAKARATRMTSFLAKRIRAYALRHPAKSQQDIGAVFKVNSGRVSEALRNKRNYRQ